MSTVIAPVAGFSGRVAGVQFDNGKAETDDERALGYFRRRGYEVDGERREQPAPPERVDARDVTVQHGPKLRDASVDPRPGDRPVLPVHRDSAGRPGRKAPGA